MEIKRQNITSLVNQFLNQVSNHLENIELVKVLKARVYQVGNSNVLIRAASEGNRHYFFGINYITLEEIANLENPFIAFVCGSIDKTIIIPAQIIFQHLSEISHDRNGEYKINVDQNYNIVLKGRMNRLDTSGFINAWNLLNSNEELKSIKSADESIHAILQGRLLEIGNLRGFKTFCPDKSKKFNQKKLSEISSLKVCPSLEFSNYKVLRNIDVIWFSERSDRLIPEKAFEVEISTGTWSGVGRLATLLDYRHVDLFVISNNIKRFNQAMHSFTEYEQRYKFVPLELLGDLYSAEKNLKELQNNIGL